MDDWPQTPFPQPGYGPPAPAPRQGHRTRRLVAVAAAAALVTGVGGVGAGYVLGHHFRTEAPTPAAGGTQQAGTSGGGPDIQNIPGWGAVPMPADPFGDDGGSSGNGQPGTQGGGSTDTTSTATGSQVTGLVRVVSTMKYAGARAAGTGMILTSDGEVVTNHHVVEGSTSIKVKVMSTGKTYVATVVGTDAKDDVAVLRLTGASGLGTVTPDTNGIAVGDAVTAVGDANGTVGHLTAATGRVLALKQSITTQSEGTATGERLTGLTQISSDVVSGDSGGATYDAAGKVVGMTTAASAGSSDVVGYAVPIAKVLRIAGDLEGHVASARYDYTAPAFLGVGLGRTGTTVQGVYPGTPADRAGIGAGDRITAVGATKVTTSTRLRAAIAALSPGDSTTITWVDAQGSSHTATVTLATGAVE